MATVFSLGRAAPAIGEQYALARHVFGAHEHFVERRMQYVRRLRFHLSARDERAYGL